MADESDARWRAFGVHWLGTDAAVIDLPELASAQAEMRRVDALIGAPDGVSGAVVYELFDADENLLYVGVSENLRRRLVGHRSTSPWFPRVTRARVRRFPTRAEAEAEEHRLHTTTPTPHNVAVGTGRFPR